MSLVAERAGTTGDLSAVNWEYAADPDRAEHLQTFQRYPPV